MRSDKSTEPPKANVTTAEERAKRDCLFNAEMLKGFSHLPLPPRVIKDKCNVLFFHWYTALIQLGQKRPIEMDDLWHVPEFNKCSVVTPALDREFAKQQRIRPKSKHPFVWALLYTRLCDTIFCGFLKVLGEGILYVLPILLKLLLEFVENPDQYEAWYPFVIVAGMCAVTLVHLTAFQGYVDLTTRCGMHRRVATQGLVYRKSLCVDMSATDAGQINNLMSNDAMKIQLGSLMVQNFYWQPISAFICIALLFDVVGVAALAGFGVMLLLIPFQIVFARCVTKIRRDTLYSTDARVGAVREFLLGVKIVKILTWENPSKTRLDALREKELAQIVRAMVIDAVNFLLLDIIPLVVAIVTIAVYVNIDGNEMTPSIVFTALSLLAMLRKPLQIFPFVLTTTLDGWVGAKRVEKFLLLPEIIREPFVLTDDSRNVAIELKNVSAKWRASVDSRPKKSKQSPTPDPTNANKSEAAGPGAEPTDQTESTSALSNISLALGPGVRHQHVGSTPPTFGVVIGAVGSGKSSLIHMILGDMEFTHENDVLSTDSADLPSSATELQTRNSNRSVIGTVAFVPQVPYILNETLRENILFGRTFNPEWYDRVIFACCLTQDLLELPHGDLTVIGERGINISGGQKMRVALARAVYADAQIYLIDDALAAVDAHVARHIFDHVYLGVLKHKTRLVSMHQLQYIYEADIIYCMGTSTPTTPRERDGDNDNDDEDNSGVNCFIATSGTLQELQAEAHPVYVKLTANSSAFADNPGTQSIDSSESPSSDNGEADAPKLPSVAGVEQTEETPKDGELDEDKRVAAQAVSIDTEDRSSTIVIGKVHLDVSSKGFEQRGGKQEDDAADHAKTLETQGATLSKEERVTGGVSAAHWALYFKSMGGGLCVATVLTYGGSRALVVYADFVLEEWADLYDNSTNVNLSLSSTVAPSADTISAFTGLPLGDEYLLIYGILGVAASIVSALRSVVYVSSAWYAAKRLYTRMMLALSNAPMRFFDVTPVGRVLSRTAEDTKQVDEQLPVHLRHAADSLFLLLSSLIVIAIVIPIMIVPMVCLSVVFVYLAVVYGNVSREAKRITAIARSPVFTHFNQTLQGVTSILTFGVVDPWTVENDRRVDEHFRAQYCSLTAKRWLNQRLDLISLAIATLTQLYVAYFHETVGAAAAGLAVSYALQVTKAMQQTIYSYSEFELGLNAVERVSAFQQIAPEAAHSEEDYVLDSEAVAENDISPQEVELTEAGAAEEDVLELAEPELVDIARTAMTKHRRRKPTRLLQTAQGRLRVQETVAAREAKFASWPEHGAVEFRNFTMRYAPELPDVLVDLSFQIPPKSKVGIFGRTGSGKSSLSVALFRLVEGRAGSILIDGEDVSEMGLGTLRSNIGMVPQEPTLFEGTLRYNLDPWDEYEDAQLWEALEKVQLAAVVRGQDRGLECVVELGGVNWSVGQRQLFCMARVLLRQIRILVLDEASASIDAENDFLLQSMIRTEFKDCTVLTIAHRMDTIADSDLVLELDHGRVAYFGPPQFS